MYKLTNEKKECQKKLKFTVHQQPIVATAKKCMRCRHTNGGRKTHESNEKNNNTNRFGVVLSVRSLYYECVITHKNYKMPTAQQ